jgi:hypothetical protein
MNVSDFTMCECKVREAAATGTLVDLRVCDPAVDAPEKATEWGPKRTVRAEVIADLLIGNGEAASVPVRGVRIQGARITGELNLEASTLLCPLALLDCSFDSAINLNEATAVSVRLSGSHIPAVRARQLRTRGDLKLDEGFCVSGGVEVASAHIGGQLDCKGGQFSNPSGYALNAFGLIVDGGMFCDEGFTASGEVLLRGAHIAGYLYCTGGHFSNANGYALNANRLSVDGSMYCGEGFSATGEVRLLGAHIGSQLFCTGGQFSNPGGSALNADRLTVEGGMVCRQGFSATGKVSLSGAHISGQFDCTGGQFANPGGSALNLKIATVSGPLRMESVVLQGILDLTGAKTSSYQDNPTTSLQKLRLDGFVYDAIEGATAKERLEWLRRNEKGYSPQIYDQLASVYRRTGHDEDARRILIAKQRRRSAEGNLAGRMWGWLLDATVGYGYRTWLAALWLIGFLILGTWLFGSVYRGELTPANKPDVQPPFQPFFYTLDLLLPVVSLHVRDAWIAQGAAQVWSVIFIIVGWILASAVVLSLTGFLKRD